MKVLSRDEIERIIDLLREYYGIKEIPFDLDDFIFIKNKEGKVFILRKEFQRFLKKLNSSNNGLYILKFEKNGIRFSIEGSQLLGVFAEKRIIEHDLKDFYYVSKEGKEIKISKEDGFYILKYGKDFGGSIEIKRGMVKDFIPKDRKIYV